jgi:hypothetical protein
MQCYEPEYKHLVEKEKFTPKDTNMATIATDGFSSDSTTGTATGTTTDPVTGTGITDINTGTGTDGSASTPPPSNEEIHEQIT